MKKAYNFSKFFMPAVILSCVLIIGGLVSAFTKGFNKGLDFAPGQSIEVSIDTEKALTSDDVSAVLASLNKKIEVKTISNEGKVSYQIRTNLDEVSASSDELNKDANAMDNDEAAIIGALKGAYGADKVTEIQKNVITAQYSASLIKNSVYLVLATLVLIFLYSAFRFNWDFGLAAVIAIIHDSLIMVGFISVFGLEFTTTTIAAILTIIGYSINATVVILDRVRSDIKRQDLKNINEVLDASLTGTLSRSIITTVTTLFAVLSLVYFTTGDIHNFGVALVVGLISGCYSSMFIASAFISMVRKNWSQTVTSNVYKMES